MSVNGVTPPPSSPPCSDPFLYTKVLLRERDCLPSRSEINDTEFPLKCGLLLDTFSCVALVIEGEHGVTCYDKQILTVINNLTAYIEKGFALDVKDCKFDFDSDLSCMNPMLVVVYAASNDLWPEDILNDSDLSFQQTCVALQTGFELTFKEIEKDEHVTCTQHNVIVSMTLFSPLIEKQFGFRLADCLNLAPPGVFTTPSSTTLGRDEVDRLLPAVSRPPFVVVENETSGYQMPIAAIVGVAGGLFLALLVGILVGFYFRKKRKRRAHGAGNNPVIHHQHSRNTLENRFHNNMAYNLSFSHGQGQLRKGRRSSGEYCELNFPSTPENVYKELSSMKKPEYCYADGNTQSVSSQCNKESDVYYLDVSQINTPTDRPRLPVPNS